MRLTEAERDILRCAELNARAEATALRRACGQREHTIRYCLKRALDEGVIAPRCFVNLGLLGLSQFEIYFSLSSDDPASRKGVLRALHESERVSWMGELGGDFQYGVNIFARNAKELSDFLDGLSAKYGPIFLEKQMALRVSLDYFGSKHLSKLRPAPAMLSSSSGEKQGSIDELDHRVLDGIMESPGESTRALAQRLRLPRSTVELRVKKLEEQGVIVGYYHIIDPAKVGIQSFLLLVGTKSVSSDVRSRLRKLSKNHPNIVLFIHSIGAWDFELAVEVENARTITSMTAELHHAVGPDLRFIRVLPIFQYSKVREYPFRLRAP